MPTPTYAELLELNKRYMSEIMQTGRTVTADGRTLSHDALSDIRGNIDWLEGKVARSKRSGRNRVLNVVPRV